MGKLGSEIMKGIITVTFLVLLLIIPTYVFGTKSNTQLQEQIIHTNTGDYIIYLKGFTDKEFSFALSSDENASEIDLSYINSVKDQNENNVVLISKEKSEEIKNDSKVYLYVKTEKEELNKKINLIEAFEQSKMEEAEKTTTRIKTEVETDIKKQDEEINGVKITVTVGGIKILDDDKSDFYYASTKLPVKEYTELVELANKINNEYNDMDMYTKIETTKKFNELYTKLSKEQKWNKVDNMIIMQPEDAQKDEQYVVYLKKVDEQGNETIDLKIMTSYREDSEEKIPGRTETKIVKETTKLPITGDSIILFVILAVIILVAIIVFVRMKKIEGKKAKK